MSVNKQTETKRRELENNGSQISVMLRQEGVQIV